eukprot:SAG11_NODE_235_length_11852_cov_4.266020_16_plen_173_part_00
MLVLRNEVEKDWLKISFGAERPEDRNAREEAAKTELAQRKLMLAVTQRQDSLKEAQVSNAVHYNATRPGLGRVADLFLARNLTDLLLQQLLGALRRGESEDYKKLMENPDLRRDSTFQQRWEKIEKSVADSREDAKYVDSETGNLALLKGYAKCLEDKVDDIGKVKLFMLQG